MHIRVDEVRATRVCAGRARVDNVVRLAWRRINTVRARSTPRGILRQAIDFHLLASWRQRILGEPNETSELLCNGSWIARSGGGKSAVGVVACFHVFCQQQSSR